MWREKKLCEHVAVLVIWEMFCNCVFVSIHDGWFFLYFNLSVSFWCFSLSPSLSHSAHTDFIDNTIECGLLLVDFSWYLTARASFIYEYVIVNVSVCISVCDQYDKSVAREYNDSKIMRYRERLKSKRIDYIIDRLFVVVFNIYVYVIYVVLNTFLFLFFTFEYDSVVIYAVI